MGKYELERYTKEKRNQLRDHLASLQQQLMEYRLPVIIIIEGWGAAGKGSAISSTIRYMDPRFFRVYNMDKIVEDEWRRPFLYRYAVKMPAIGQMAILDGGYLDELVKDYLSENISKKEYENRIQSVCDYERSMKDNGYLFVKIFIDMDQKTQQKRLKKLQENKNTRWRVTDEDLWQNENYEQFAKEFERLRKATNTIACPWHLLTTSNEKNLEGDILTIISNSIDNAITARQRYGTESPVVKNPFLLVKGKPLQKISLQDKLLSKDEYQIQLLALQTKLKKLHYKLYNQKIPVVIAYEGWDAAGKGGNIKRVASALDARGYEVFPIASPTAEEKNRHFLWRFYNRLPKSGHIAIFDRTWYGRVMVERIEGFCTENDWQRAYNEINEFERDLTNAGVVLIKFWMQIDKDTQLARFTERQNTPEKQWKITDEDWRNREKWDLYEEAVDEMLQKTSTSFAPWYVIEANDKKYARIATLKLIISKLEKRLKEEK